MDVILEKIRQHVYADESNGGNLFFLTKSAKSTSKVTSWPTGSVLNTCARKKLCGVKAKCGSTTKDLHVPPFFLKTKE